MHGPKPYKLIGFGDMPGPKACELIGFGDGPRAGPGTSSARALGTPGLGPPGHGGRGPGDHEAILNPSAIPL